MTEGFYWIDNNSSLGPCGKTIAHTPGDQTWSFPGVGGYTTGPVSVLRGPLKFEPEPVPVVPFQPTSNTAAIMAALHVATKANVEMAANLTATQARCTELLDEARAKGRTIEWLERELRVLRGV